LVLYIFLVVGFFVDTSLLLVQCEVKKMKIQYNNSARSTTNLPDDSISCQITNLPEISNGNMEMKQYSFRMRLLLSRKRFLGYEMRRKIRRQINKVTALLYRIIQKKEKPVQVVIFPTLELSAGDLVRVRSWEEIQSTLDKRNDFKGCGFMLGMKQYCGTIQRVLKPIERFVDERDYRLKKCKGVVILDGLNCQGDDTFGRCDRACFYFWRVEWLERAE
jgi:hypothetical protein